MVKEVLTRMPRKRRVLSKACSFLFLVVIASALSVVMYAASGLVQNGGSAPSTQPQSANGQRPWIKSAPFAAHTVLHWRQINLNYVSGGIDPTNGKEVLADIWVQFGADSHIVTYHAIYTYLDGTFVQEIFETSKINTVIQSKVYAVFLPKPLPKNWCITEQSTNQDELQSRFPPFADESMLLADNFHRSGSILTKPLPTTPSVSGLTPVEVYDASGSIGVWSQELHQQDLVTTSMVEVGLHDRVLIGSSKTQDSAGTVKQANWVTLGQLDIYKPAPALTPFLMMSPQSTKGCNR
jgi:hypothetical protein